MIDYNTIPTDTDLETYLVACRKLAADYTAANPGSFACSYHTDVERWNKDGIYTVQDLLRYDLETLVWDLYKSVHGIRPRFMNLKEMSTQELEDVIKNLNETAKWNAEMEEKYAAQQAADDAWNAEVQAHESTFCIPGELQFFRGAWAVA